MSPVRGKIKYTISEQKDEHRRDFDIHPVPFLELLNRDLPLCTLLHSIFDLPSLVSHYSVPPIPKKWDSRFSVSLQIYSALIEV